MGYGCFDCFRVSFEPLIERGRSRFERPVGILQDCGSAIPGSLQARIIPVRLDRQQPLFLDRGATMLFAKR